MSFWPVVKYVIKNSDVVLEILDARIPELSKNSTLEKMCRTHGKHLIRVFTKIDLISESNLASIKELNKDAFFVSGTRNIGLKKLKTHLLIYAKRNNIENLRVGVTGYPNMGKSAMINALAHRERAKVSPVAGTTRGVQFIRAGNLYILDSPGVIPVRDKDTTLGMMGAKNPEKVKNLHRVVFALIRNFLEKNKSSLEKNYNIKIEPNDDEYAILIKIGQKRGFLKKGGEMDENRTMLSIIREWQKGKLRI